MRAFVKSCLPGIEVNMKQECKPFLSPYFPYFCVKRHITVHISCISKTKSVHKIKNL